MAGMKKLVMCFVLVVVTAVALAPCGVLATVTCNTVTSDIAPCASYLMGSGPLSSSCCSGVNALYSAASTTPDRQSVCNCLKEMMSSTKNVDLSKAAGLPGDCGLNIPYKIDPSTDCATVQ